MSSNLKPGDPGYGTKDPPKSAPPKKLSNKPSWKDWQNPSRWRDTPSPTLDSVRPQEAVPKK